MRYIIDGKAMTDRDCAHAELKRALELPDYYGENLDALWDCLTDLYEGEIVMESTADMLNSIRNYGCEILKTLMDVCNETQLTFLMK